MKNTKDKKLLQQTLGLMLSVLIFAGCNVRPAEPSATSTPSHPTEEVIAKMEILVPAEVLANIEAAIPLKIFRFYAFKSDYPATLDDLEGRTLITLILGPELKENIDTILATSSISITGKPLFQSSIVCKVNQNILSCSGTGPCLEASENFNFIASDVKYPFQRKSYIFGKYTPYPDMWEYCIEAWEQNPSSIILWRGDPGISVEIVEIVFKK